PDSAQAARSGQSLSSFPTRRSSDLAVALHIRSDRYDYETELKLDEIKRTSDLIAKLSGMYVQANKAIIGRNAYAHESGIHQDGVLKNAETYEIITPELVGVSSNTLFL